MAHFTVVPTTPPTMLPFAPTDGQVFVDYDGVKWRYEADSDLWLRYGAVEKLPMAGEDSEGLLAGPDKRLLDDIAQTPGGFGIITSNNPLGPVTGDIVLTSESLDIRCVGTNDQPIGQPCVDRGVSVCEGSVNPNPGITFGLKEEFLKGLVVNLPGQAGPRGDRGPKGIKGPPGYSQGPKGEKGDKGDSSSVRCTLDSLEFEDVPGVTDSAVVDVRMQQNCNLVYTKAKIKVPTGPAEKLSAQPVTRSVSYDGTVRRDDCDVYKRMGDWTLHQPPGDQTPLDMRLVRLAKNRDNAGPGTAFNTYPLTSFIGDVTAEYERKLRELDESWRKEVKEYVQGVDDKARNILSELADELAQCEFNTPAQICVTIDEYKKYPVVYNGSTGPSMVVNMFGGDTVTAPVAPGTPVTPGAPSTPDAQATPVVVADTCAAFGCVTTQSGQMNLVDKYGALVLNPVQGVMSIYPEITDKMVMGLMPKRTIYTGCRLVSVPCASTAPQAGGRSDCGTLTVDQVPVRYDFYCETFSGGPPYLGLTPPTGVSNPVFPVLVVTMPACRQTDGSVYPAPILGPGTKLDCLDALQQTILQAAAPSTYAVIGYSDFNSYPWCPILVLQYPNYLVGCPGAGGFSYTVRGSAYQTGGVYSAGDILTVQAKQ